ncbi:PilZ domain-containing protein [Stenotrophomonas geniculata]|uniref:PilZ domain-containing protein n=1 Tax=Stenotrophomonas TaxID=40323 RepID=UPI00062DA287|nr:PilZ domain-containing protein [Stenotrophomonas maltophilia]MCO7463799.1 PilZ domain-containing protein [Stenotrophomonas maltophilia]TIE13213.1 pilus assembly protein PilZ [Stenotrophomonas maltophilia]TIE57897.1 pilus assembly protein PilZ [Stenotrophomonas maltophilia]HEL2960814.1 PilZ domain-containing protein [Stenotrophomonas maltophilia]HEL4237400.1 PilZ domain-containing protein [Stenotrophomonas maltophilia]
MKPVPPQDTRRAPRRQVSDLVPVTDQMRECVVGRLGNVSETGMLMLASAPLREDALYQLRFPLPMGDGRQEAIDVGVHLLWSEPAHAPGQSWTGFRFLTLSREHRQLLRQWVGEDSDEGPVSTA